MKNLESFSALDIEGQPDPFLEKLWKKYHFRGNPPISGSEAENRLKDACNSYFNLVSNPDLYNPILKEDSENYFSKNRNVNYDIRRRELHNIIALMVVGQQRSGMGESLALKIADFAIEYVSGK